MIPRRLRPRWLGLETAKRRRAYRPFIYECPNWDWELVDRIINRVALQSRSPHARVMVYEWSARG